MSSRVRRRAAQVGAARAAHWRRRCALLGLALASSGCGAGASVPRVMHGRTIEGPIVSDRAYAAYARGAYLEAKGQRASAIDAYRAALAADSHGAAIWTRLGALYCSERASAAEDAFDEAIELAPGYAAAWSNRAECRKRRGQLDEALADAVRAVALDPDDTAANLLVATLYREQRRLPEAKAWLLGLVLRSPEPSAHWAALAAAAEASNDPGLARHARARLREREARREHVAPATGDAAIEPSSELLDALREQDLLRARSLAASQRIDARALALLAAAHGHSALAAQQANLVLAADPSDPDALLAALSAAASSGDPQQLAALLEHADGERRPSALGARLFADLLLWFVGEEAAAAWTRTYGARSAR
jgi:hypothetical protein